MTMPAIAPPLSPLPPPLPPEFEPAAPPVSEVEEELGDEDVVVKRFGMEEKTGRLTSWQRPVAFEVRQQESVPFCVLARQKLQRPGRLAPKPQLSGSFASPGMQLPLSELAGNAQLVKSALNWSAYPSLRPEQRSLLATMDSSLSASWAQESAHNGISSGPFTPQGCLEFWTMLLQMKLVVYRA